MDKTIQVTQPSLPPFDEYVNEIRDIWDNRWLSNFGPKLQKLRANLIEYLQCDNLSLFANGHLALEAALTVMELKGEVITTPFTFASTTQAIVRSNLTPVFCDIDPVSYTLDANILESMVTEKTCAIMPVHVYGNLCDHRRIDEIAQKYGLKVIYDAAHAFGMKENGVSVGNFGDVSMFSFHCTKVFHTIEGGALSYSDRELSDKFEQWCMFGMQGNDDVVRIGTNAKLTEFAAAMGLCNLRHIDELFSLRREAVKRYRERLSGCKGIILCDEHPAVEYNYTYMPVRFVKGLFGKTRDEICERLEHEKISARKYFYPLTSDFSVYCDMFPISKTPVAKEISEQILCLPLYSEMPISDVDRICDILLSG